MPFDPEATGVIPKLTFDKEPSAPEGSEGPDSPADPDEAAADQTTTFRIPGPLHIGHPPTAAEDSDPGAAGTVSMPVQSPDDASSPEADGTSSPDADGAAERADGAPESPGKPGPSTSPGKAKTASGKAGSPASGKTGTPTAAAPKKASAPATATPAEAGTPEGAAAKAGAADAPPKTDDTATGKTGQAPPPAKTGDTPTGKEQPSAKTGQPQSPTTPDTTPTNPGLRTQPTSGPQPAGGPQPTNGPQPAGGGQARNTSPSSGGAKAPSGPQPATGAKSTGSPQPTSGPQQVAGGKSTGGPQPVAAQGNVGAKENAGESKGASPAEAPAKETTKRPATGTPSAGGKAADASAAAGTLPRNVMPTGAPPTGASTTGAPTTGAPTTGGPAAGGPSALVQPVGAPSKAPSGPGGPSALPQQSPPRQAAAEAASRPRTAGGRIGALIASAPKWLPVLLVLEGLIMYVLALKVPPGPLRGVDPNDIDGLGLISALPATAFIAILIMIVSFFVTVAQSTDRKFLLLFQIAAITFALHGAGALVAEEPRFPTAYIHAGFVDFISRTGETAISIDARMGWPGFFALFAFVTKAAGITDMTPILQWTPLLSNLLYLLPFVLILRQVVATTRARWFAALLFVLVQWIGQDYFSPQGFTFALYLAWVAILLRWFGRVEPRTKPIPPKGLRRLLGRLDAMTPGELANTGTYRADKLLMLMMLLALFFAAVASHQITPFMMLGVVTAFLIFKRTSLTWALPFFLGLVVLAWISYMTVGFWASQIDAIFGGLGNILQNLRSNTGDRIEGSDPAHAMVLQARLGILVVILGLAAAGLFRRLRRGVFDRSALILLCVPVLALGLQSYGGEIGLRIYMFALPGACLLAAYAFFPNLPADSADVREETVPLRKRNVRFNPQLTRKISVVLAACFAVLFAFAFFLARYGNEKFERVTAGEVAAMHYVYDHDKPSARVIYLVPKEGPEVTPTMPWGERDVEIVSFNQQALVHKDPTKIADAVKKLKESARNSYLMVSRGQVSYLQLNEGFPADWGERFRAALDASPDLKRVYSNKDAALYTWKKFVRGTEIPEPNQYQGRGDPTSPWTPVGVGALGVTWVALFGYEIIRLNGPNRARKARRRLLYLAVPAFVVAIAVIVERFVYIAQNN
ncbi:hypothetical protein [Nonomuraea sp. SYSU D8015]|uniref:hypothetical protein n=1 Tax=Nonomuraea sp. SYSU D8015 TaxID=2593644 RepID=UPI0016601957|nr:hypothetical protein [Nonomuraea sp. SYSU D8015]